MYEDASQVVAEAIGSIRTVASFGAEKRVITLYSQKCQASMKQGIRSGMVGGVGFSFSNLMLYLTYALCFYVGAQFVHDGKSTFQDVFRVRYTRLICEIILFNDLINRSDTCRFTLPWFSLLLEFPKQVPWHQTQQKVKNLRHPY